MHVNLIQSSDDLLHRQVQNWWRTDLFGTKFEHQSPRSREDARALEMLEKTVKHCGDRYEVGLLWKDENVELPKNRVMAEKRLESTERMLKRNNEVSEKYCQIIEDYVSKGYARKLTKAEIESSESKEWFLPHHPVLNPNKPGKVRIVMDAAAKHQGISLNDNLLIGPDLLNSLVGVLLRFREFPFAIAADIEAMFLQCRIISPDQPSLKFLWRNLDKGKSSDVYQMTSMIFGAASSPCTANYVLRKTANDNCHDPEFSKDTIEAVHTNFYMDDFLKSVPDEAQAIRMQKEITSLVARGGFRLTKWTSSSREVLLQIPDEEKACPFSNLDLDDLPMERTLGLKWNTETDGFRFSSSTCDVTPTKRGILSHAATVFDPLGVLAPLLLTARSLIQSLWRKKRDWDEPLDESDIELWDLWQRDLASLADFEISRCLCPEIFPKVSVELHVFGDASELAFGAVSYARFIFPNGKIYVAFIMSRSRMAPLRQLSIPRLELQAAVLSCRLADSVKRNMTLNIISTTFWSDSKIVLQYIQNESRRFHTFVANRVSEIQDSSESSQWRHVPGNLNPADDCTRGLRASEITTDSRWINGPPFLWQTEEKWPPQTSITRLIDDDVEVKASWVGHIALDKSCFPDAEKYSSWTRFRRVVAWMCRFIHNARCPEAKRIRSTLTAAELEKSEEICVKRSQEESFAEDILALKKGKPLPSRSRLLSLRPVIDENGALRVGGRLSKALVPEKTKHPLILDSKSQVTRLIITHYHQRLRCASVNHVRNELRQRYWILKGLATVRKISFKCVLCRLRRARAQAPVMADLPSCRLASRQPPFTHTGVVYFGPLLVRHGRKTEKRYGVLFTCMTTRAVHLEIAHSLEADAYIMALRRMISRRGSPAHVYSDNGTNFVGAEKELREALEEWNKKNIADQLSQNGVQWHFNPPASPHFGGAWERLVQSTKRVLKIIAGEQLVTDETLLTFFAEVESLLNSRPLTHLGGDCRDEEALTPNHFLLGRASLNLPPGIVVDRDLCGRKAWKHAQVMTEHFWRRWIREYLPSLTERQKWKREVRNIAVDDVVLVADENSPRGRWHVGRVVKTLPETDGRVRTAEVKTKTGSYVHPVAKLCVLEQA